LTPEHSFYRIEGLLVTGVEVPATMRHTVMTQDAITISPGSRFRAAMMLAMIADALQIFVFPLFVEGALSPADDVLDFGVAALLVNLLGWHWEFLPSFFAKLVPGVDLVPFWTMAVANVYRKSKQIAVAEEEDRRRHPALPDAHQDVEQKLPFSP
jgi:hypothetical protein